MVPRVITVGSGEDELQRFQSYIHRGRGFTPVTRLPTGSDCPQVLEVEFRELPDRSGWPKTADNLPLRDHLPEKMEA